jgi:hypothetical protein
MTDLELYLSRNSYLPLAQNIANYIEEAGFAQLNEVDFFVRNNFKVGDVKRDLLISQMKSRLDRLTKESADRTQESA